MTDFVRNYETNRQRLIDAHAYNPVSYTHLTLPTTSRE